MHIEGILGTRADLIVDIVMLASAALPFLMILAIRFAKKQQYDIHKWFQIVLLFVVLILVIALEADIRFGGIDEVIAQSRYHESTALLLVFLVHLVFAISSFALWVWLVVKSANRYPTHFTFDHKKYGKIVFVDVTLTVITGWILYALVFTG